MHEIVYKHLNVLCQSERMQEVFADAPLIAYRRDTNLYASLVPGVTNKTVNSIADACEAGCTYCAILLRTSIQDALKITHYRPEVKVNCRLQNVVCVISCSRCDVVDGDTSPG